MARTATQKDLAAIRARIEFLEGCVDDAETRWKNAMNRFDSYASCEVHGHDWRMSVRKELSRLVGTSWEASRRCARCGKYEWLICDGRRPNRKMRRFLRGE